MLLTGTNQFLKMGKTVIASEIYSFQIYLKLILHIYEPTLNYVLTLTTQWY